MELQQQDENSRQVIETALDQCLMVEAAAGTGKTTSIVARMVNLIAEGVCPATHLAAVTFTRKAAAELRQRFTEALQQRLVEYQQQPASLSGVQRSRRDRLTAASQLIGQLSIETIHSFCARMIRERPVEFGVDPAFGQLDAETESSIRRAAWEQNLAELKSAGDPLLGQLAEVGLRSGQLRQCFDNFLNFRDISDWPIVAPQPFDIEACRHRVEEYLQHIRQTVRSFLPGRRDELMARYEQVDRFSLRMDASPRILFELLELFERSPDITQKCWPNGTANKGAVPKAELARFKQFRNEVVEPALKYWRQYRYQFVVRFVCRAVETYHHLKATSSGLDFTDLLLITANGLRQQPHLRRYFQHRFSHLLVDEFQDTDPIQAEIVALLGSEDVHETNWQACRLRPGSLFIVGDPKQSIYRFRRGDIVTYNHTKALFIRSGGRVVLLSRNFRSSAELIAWNNEVFSDIFQATADTHDAVTAHSPMFSGKARTVRGELSGVAKLAVPDKLDAPIEWEAEQVARFIRQAIDRKLTIEVPKPGTDDQWQLRAVTAADFLILMRNKRHMGQYQLALERLQLECDIAGNNALDSLAELRVLHLCTQAVDDPYNPVHYLSLLRDQLFGFDDAQLYELKRAGGSFQFTAQLPSSLEESLRGRFARVNQLLMDSQLWLRMLPPATALTKIATALGLLASAAAGTDGNLALGTMLKAIEMIRHRSWQFDCAADVISAIEDLLESDEIEGVSARASSGDAVRLMNLHKAKGLEAPIVLLVDASKRTEFAPRHYIARTGDRPVGYMWITTKNKFQERALAEPGGWEDLQALEKQFQDAEENRLLYVATTRAANMLVVTCSSQSSCWSPLEHYVADLPALESFIDGTLDSSGVDQPTRGHCSPYDPDLVAALNRRWQQASTATYQTVNIKKEALRGRARPQWQTTTDGGPAWGTALHQLLEMIHRFPNTNIELQATAIAIENELDSTRVPELVTSVRAVVASAVWRRAQVATRSYVEVPIDASELVGGLPSITRGVIDLVFEEHDGWVIVDTKTDQVTQAESVATYEYYRGQLEAYATYWQVLTGQRVKEVGIYLTRLDLYLNSLLP